MDPRVRARTCIRTRDRLPCELPGQTRPSPKSFLTLYFFLELTQSVLYVKPNPLLFTQDMVSSSLAISFSFPFPFPSSKLNPHNPSSLEFRRHTPTSHPTSSGGPISRVRRNPSPRANSSTMAAVFPTSWPMAHMPSAHSFVASQIPSNSSERTHIASTCASASFLTELARAHITRSIPVVPTGGSTTQAAGLELASSSSSLDESSDSIVAFETTRAFFCSDAIALSGRLDTPVPAMRHLTHRFAHWTHTRRPFPLGHLQVNPSRSHPLQTFATGSGSCIPCQPSTIPSEHKLTFRLVPTTTDMLGRTTHWSFCQ